MANPWSLLALILIASEIEGKERLHLTVFLQSWHLPCCIHFCSTSQDVFCLDFKSFMFPEWMNKSISQLSNRLASVVAFMERAGRSEAWQEYPFWDAVQASPQNRTISCGGSVVSSSDDSVFVLHELMALSLLFKNQCQLYWPKEPLILPSFFVLCETVNSLITSGLLNFEFGRFKNLLTV